MPSETRGTLLELCGAIGLDVIAARAPLEEWVGIGVEQVAVPPRQAEVAVAAAAETRRKSVSSRAQAPKRWSIVSG